MKCFISLTAALLLLGCGSAAPNPITSTECGGQVGDHACDFSFVQQSGEKWNLYDQYGSIIVLDFSTMWCAYCQEAGKVAQEIQNTHGGKDVVWATILLQNNYGQPPTVEDLNEWASAFEMTSSPVLSGNDSIIDPAGLAGYGVTTWPGIVIIDRDMTIAYELKGWNEMQIKYWLDELTSPVEHEGK